MPVLDSELGSFTPSSGHFTSICVRLTFKLAGLLLVILAFLLAVRRPEAKLILLRLAAHAQSVLVLPLDMLVLFTALLLNELLNQGNLVVGTGVHGVTCHHVVRQGHDNLAVRHLFVVEGVNLGEK